MSIASRIRAWWRIRQLRRDSERELRRCPECFRIHDGSDIPSLNRALWCGYIREARLAAERQAQEDAKPGPRSLYALPDSPTGAPR